MLRVGTSAIAKRAILNSTRGTPACAVPRASFHLSAPRNEEQSAEITATAPVSKGGLFGTGLSEWFALPIGIVAAIPAIKLEWYIVNEETQLAAVFIAFCVTLYTQGGDAIHKSLDEKAVNLLKEHNEAEDKVINALEEQLEFLQGNTEQVQHFEAINTIRGETYEKLNAAGVIKPKHDFKSQVEKMLGMIAAEETSVAEKAKTALMEEATASVSDQFTSSKALKKAALDAAIAAIKGGEMKEDPVRKAFVKFFADKSVAAAKADDGSEEAANRAALVAKMNSIAKNEQFFFSFDESGNPKMAN